jgi:4-amino-4-deoxy-L-arabinose transferase-like glycosyltransferase
LADLGRESFWLDEAGRAAIAAQPLGTIPSAVGVIELSPPLYHLLLHGWLRLVGDGDFAARLLSALLGTAAIPATYLLARALLDRRTALVAALLAAVAPLYVVYGREAAMYALFLVLSLLATLGYVGWLRGMGCLVSEGATGRMEGDLTAAPGSPAAPTGRPARGLWLYGAAILLALYTHYYALFLVAAQNAHLFVLLWRRELPRGAGRAWLLVQAVLIVCYLPWLPLLLRQARLAASVSDWAAPDPLAALGGLVLAFGVGPAVELPAALVALVALPALWAGLRAAARRPGLLALLGCYLLVPVALGLLAAYPLHAFRERGFIAVAWVPQLLVAAGLVGLLPTRGEALPAKASWLVGPWRPSALVHVYAVALVALLLYGTATEIAEPKEAWRDAAALVAALGQEGDVLFVMHYGSQLALNRYLPDGLPRRGLPDDFTWAQGYTSRYRLEPTDLDRRVAPELTRHRRAWAILSHADGRGDSLLLDYFDARYPSVWSQDLYGIRLRLWQLRPD